MTSGLPDIWRERVAPEWCDYNNHMNLAYYVLIFDHATDAFYNSLGLDDAYRASTECSTFAVESHTNYIAEVHEGDEVYCTAQLLDYDEKRLHYFHCMYHAEKGFLSATTELMAVHVDMKVRRVAPMGKAVLRAAEEMFGTHRDLPRPAQAGRSIGIRRK